MKARILIITLILTYLAGLGVAIAIFGPTNTLLNLLFLLCGGVLCVFLVLLTMLASFLLRVIFHG